MTAGGLRAERQPEDLRANDGPAPQDPHEERRDHERREAVLRVVAAEQVPLDVAHATVAAERSWLTARLSTWMRN